MKPNKGLRTGVVGRTLLMWGLIELDSTQNGRLAAIFGFLLQHSVDD